MAWRRDPLTSEIDPLSSVSLAANDAHMTPPEVSCLIAPELAWMSKGSPRLCAVLRYNTVAPAGTESPGIFVAELSSNAKAPGFGAPHCLQAAADAKHPGVWWLRQLGVGHCQSPGLPGWNIGSCSSGNAICTMRRGAQKAAYGIAVVTSCLLPCSLPLSG